MTAIVITIITIIIIIIIIIITITTITIITTITTIITTIITIVLVITQPPVLRHYCSGAPRSTRRLFSRRFTGPSDNMSGFCSANFDTAILFILF